MNRDWTAKEPHGPGRAQGARDEGAHGASGIGVPGKRTLVEQASALAVQRRAGATGEAEPAAVQAAAAHGVATASSPLPHRDMIQRLFGRHDISAVQAHTGPDAAASAQAMGAQAFATGNHVVLGGATDLHTVAHEAAHVVQQRGGVQLKGGVGEVGDRYERNADEVADAVVQGKSAEALLDPMVGGGGGGGGAVQRMVIYTDKVGQVDKIIAGDIAKQHAFAGGALVSLAQLQLAEQDAIEIQPGEAVVISGHGAPGSIQSLPAQDIAALLSKVKHIRKARVIFLSACNTSTDKSGQEGSSVVDITHQTLEKLVPVVGSPGVKINDHTNVTGDGLTYYLPETSSAASEIEAFVTHYQRQHDIARPLQLGSLEEALERGKELLKDEQFLKFYDVLLRVLGNVDRPLIEQLVHAGDDALKLDTKASVDAWPAWLRGWFGNYQCAATTFLPWAQKKLTTARAMLGRMLEDDKLSLIARPDRGQAPLVGRPQGEGEKVGVPFNGYVNK